MEKAIVPWKHEMDVWPWQGISGPGTWRLEELPGEPDHDVSPALSAFMGSLIPHLVWRPELQQMSIP